MKNPRAKPHQIDIMTNMSGLHPLLNDFSQPRKETNSNLHINLTNVRKVDSIGLAISIGLIFLGGKPPEKYRVKLNWSGSDNANHRLHELRVVDLLNTLGFDNGRNESTVDLFDDLANTSNPITNAPESNGIFHSDGLQEVILFCPKLHTNRQDALDSFSRALKTFMARDMPRTFNHEQIIKVFIELAKNTFDHSYGFGIAGLLIHNNSIHEKTIQFVYCDTGEGICLNVRRHFAKFVGEDSSAKRRVEKGSAMDFLREALKSGFSTKIGNGLNHGMGLTLITQGAAGCGFNTLLRDADSIMDMSGLNEPYSHQRVRAQSSKSTAPNLLMFHFEKVIPSDTDNSK